MEQIKEAVYLINDERYSADCFAAAGVLHILFDHKNAECRRIIHQRSAKIQRYVR